MKNVLKLILLFTFFSIQTKAQDDPAGWYVDGVKVEKLTCYNFKNLQLVVPYNSEWAAYTHISVNIFTDHSGEWFPGSDKNGGVKIFTMNSINGFLKGNYMVYNLFTPGETSSGDIADFRLSIDNNGLIYEDGRPPSSWNVYKLRRWNLKYDLAGAKSDGKPADDVKLSFKIFGLTQTGTKEEYYDPTKSILKIPIYNVTKLTKSYNIVCSNRLYKGRKAELNKAPFTDPCPIEGTKVDFNNLK